MTDQREDYVGALRALPVPRVCHTPEHLHCVDEFGAFSPEIWDRLKSRISSQKSVPSGIAPTAGTPKGEGPAGAGSRGTRPRLQFTGGK